MLLLSTPFLVQFVLKRKRRFKLDRRTTEKAKAKEKMRLDKLMAPARDAASAFVQGGSAQVICDLIRRDCNMWPIVESAAAMNKLVDVVVHDKPKGEGSIALSALCTLASLGRGAQDAIAHAHDGAIFAWLAGKQDDRNASYKDRFIENLTRNHPTNTVRLQAARGDTVSLVDLALKGLQSGDIACATLAMNLLIGITRGKGAASAIPDSSIVTLATMCDWDPTNTDSQLSTIRAQAESVVVQFLHSDARSPVGVKENLTALSNQTSDSGVKLLAVLQLSQLVKQSKSFIQDIVAQGGVAVIAAAAWASSVGIQCKLVHEATLLLGALAQESASIRAQVLKERGFALLVRLSQSKVQAQKSAALDLLRAFLVDVDVATSIVGNFGIPFLFELLQYAKQHPIEQEIRVMAILTTVFGECDEMVRELVYWKLAECDETIQFLAQALNDSSASNGEIVMIAEKLGGLVQFLLGRLREPSGNRAKILKMLEHLSRTQTNHSLFHEHGGVKRLALLLKTSESASPEIRSTTARILANLACKNEDMSKLIVESDTLEQLIDMIKSTDNKAATASLMALRNLANCGANRDQIGTVDVVLRLIMMVKEGKTKKQKSVAAAVLGNLAHSSTSKEIILHHKGQDGILELLGDAQTPSQVEAAAAALWVLADAHDTIDKLRTVSVLQKAIQTIQPHQVPWASRLLERLT